MAERPSHILLVDHHADFRFSAKLVLENEGYRVAEAGTGEEALYRILVAQRNEEAFDLVVTEFRMPGITGLELRDEARAREIPLPPFIIMGTERPEPSSPLKSGETLEWLEKPFGPGELIEKVSAVLSRNRDEAA